MPLPFEAKRAAKAFEKDSSEMEALEERIAACECGYMLATKLDYLAEELFVQCMDVLEEHILQFPLRLTVAVNARLYRTQLTGILSADCAKDELMQHLQQLLGTLQLWCVDSNDAAADAVPINMQSPSVRPVYESILSKMTGVPGQESDDEDTAWKALAEKASARELRKQDSQDSCVSEKSAVVTQTPQEELKDSQPGLREHDP